MNKAMAAIPSRKVTIFFTNENGNTEVAEIFEAEDTHPVDMQRNGWQSILDNFRKYAEEQTQA